MAVIPTSKITGLCGQRLGLQIRPGPQLRSIFLLAVFDAVTTACLLRAEKLLQRSAFVRVLILIRCDCNGAERMHDGKKTDDPQ